MRSGSIKAPKKWKILKYNFVSWTEMERRRISRQRISGLTSTEANQALSRNRRRLSIRKISGSSEPFPWLNQLWDSAYFLR